MLPPDVEWIHSRIARFEPEANRVELITGERLHYDVLIVALGLELRWTSIPGLVQALGREGVVSIYSRRFAQDTRRMLERFAGGTAIFTDGIRLQPPAGEQFSGQPPAGEMVPVAVGAVRLPLDLLESHSQRPAPRGGLPATVHSPGPGLRRSALAAAVQPRQSSQGRKGTIAAVFCR